MLLSCATRAERSGQAADAPVRLAKDHIEIALGYLAEDEIATALNHLQRSQEIIADNAELDHAYAIYYQKRGDVEKAESSFQAAIEKEPKNPRFNNNYGAFLSQKGDYAAASRHFQIAYLTQDYSARAAAYENYGDVSSLRTEYDRAVEAYGKALELSPDWFILHIKLAKNHYGKASFNLANNHFSIYVETLQELNISPSVEDLELGIGIAAALKDFDAMGDYQDLLINLK